MSYATIINPAGSAAPTFTRDEEWVRNPFWEPIAHPADERARALYQVDNATNKLALTVTGGNFTVDWGDGSSPENFTAGALAEHSYLYSDTDLVGTEAPCTVASDVITHSNHGLSNGDPQSVYAVGGGSVVLTGYVVNATANTFQISLTLGGDPASIADGSYQLLSYRQAVVEIYPQSGQIVGVLDFNAEPTGITTGHINKILELRAHLPNSTGLPKLGFYNSTVSRCEILQSLVLTGTGGLSGPSAFELQYCKSLVNAEIESDNWTQVEGNSTYKGLFQNCWALKFVTMNTQNVTNFRDMFYGCYSLEQVQLNTSSGTNFYRTFFGCTALRDVSIDTSSGVNFQQIFYNCSALSKSVLDSLDFSAGVDLNNAFYNCDGIVGDVVLNLPLATDLSRIFHVCGGIASVTIDSPNAISYSEAFETSSVTSLDITFADGCDLNQICYSAWALSSVNMNGCSPGNLNTAFFGCGSLADPYLFAPTLDWSLVSNWSSAFGGCAFSSVLIAEAAGELRASFTSNSGLLSLEITDASGVSSTNPTANANTGFIWNSANVNSIIMGGLVVDLNIAGCKLAKSALVALFTSLGDVTAIGPKTVTVTGNPGAASLTAPDLAIATSKGWTVVT